MYILGKGITGPFGGWPEFKDIVREGSPLFGTEEKHAENRDLSRFVSTRFKRRLDHFTKMILTAAHLALEDMQQEGGEDPGRLGIILTSGYGPCRTTFDFLDGMIDHGPNMASPLAFSHSVHNVPAGILTMSLKESCPCTSICQPQMPVFSGLVQAGAWLEQGVADTVLLGAADEDTELLRYCLGRMHPGLSRENTLVQEGAAFFCLKKAAENRPQAKLTLAAPGEKSPAETRGAKLFGMHPSFPVRAAFEMAAFMAGEKDAKIALAEKNLSGDKAFICMHSPNSADNHAKI